METENQWDALMSKIYKNIIKLFKRRKCDISTAEEFHINFFKNKNTPYFIFPKLNDTWKYYIYTHEISDIRSVETTKKKDFEIFLRNFNSRLEKNPNDVLFYITRNINQNTSFRNTIKTMIKVQNIKIEYFDAIYFNFDLIKHDSQPKFIHIQKRNVKRYRKKHNLQNVKLPIMLPSDIIAKYYGAKSGDLFKIIRKNLTSGFAISYRIIS